MNAIKTKWESIKEIVGVIIVAFAMVGLFALLCRFFWWLA